MTNAPVKNVPVQLNGNVPVDQVGHDIFPRSYISERKIKQIATEKYKSSGNGITFEDLTARFPIERPQAQRSLKHFHARGILFTAKDLISQEIYLMQNTSPQQYFPTCIKADILEGFKKRKNVPVGPTGVNLSKGSLNTHSSSSCSRHPLSDNLEYQKSQSFLDVLIQLPFVPPHIHKLQLMLSIDKQYYKELIQKEGRINRAKFHEENIGRRHVTYTFYPNGKVAIDIKSSNTPFKLETDEDESVIFSFFGQVRDRLLYHVNDIRERRIPPIMQWILKGCDLNKDIEISDICQLTVPDIQLRHADRVFSQYVKSLHDKAVYRTEESLTLNHLLLPETLNNIRYPYKSIIEQIKNQVDKIERKVCNEITSTVVKPSNNDQDSVPP